ncbi:branched-chain amino acid ABC transporter permease [Maricaulis salignorans]|uniref:Amino acid/amide ABC transporter membrane protein 2, HAAT family n=1 Tax=Maricaulis salignorans TaxID=144026 RepID=A0A1G9LRN8_9PROT|nr:branched-chain amino acid ABC transporter permease [Maricaulis salignorans]SDL64608.1 amino acid/amide ABC transporter membrane protein 2, HAAT family [Maricaulis salignorans]
MMTLNNKTIAMLLAAAFLLALAAPWLIPQYRIDRLTLALIYGAATIGLVIITGRAGQLSIGHSAFFGIGAYTTGILLVRDILPLPLALLAGALAGGVLGLVFGKPALKLRGFQLAIVTAALAIVFPLMLPRFSDLTGGHAGLAIPPQFAPESWGLSSVSWMYMVTVVTIAILVFVAWAVTRNRLGRALDAIRLSELTARSMGIDVAGYKLAAFTVSAICAGLAGGLYAAAIGFIAPEAFGLLINLTFLAALMVGGSRVIAGALIGGLFVQLVPELAAGLSQAWTQLLFGAILIAVVFFLPGGLVSLIPIMQRKVSRPAKTAATTSADTTDCD